MASAHLMSARNICFHGEIRLIKALIALVGRLSLSVGRIMVLNGDLRLFPSTLNFLLFKQTVQTLIRCRVLRRLIWICNVCQCPSPDFTDNPLYTAS